MGYDKKIWGSGDTITSAALNNMENGIASANKSVVLQAGCYEDLSKNLVFVINIGGDDLASLLSAGVVFVNATVYEDETMQVESGAHQYGGISAYEYESKDDPAEHYFDFHVFGDIKQYSAYAEAGDPAPLVFEYK